MTRFEICQKDTATFEGVNSNHPADPGGKTRFGITEAVNREFERETGAKKTPIFQIPYSRALAIYKRNYWEAAKCDTLVPGVDRVVYDAAVNSGVSRGRKWLLASIGSNDDAATVKRICDKRLAFVMGLRTWRVFGKGWGRRIAFMKANGIKEASIFNSTTLDKARNEAQAAADKAKRNRDISAGTGAAGGTGGGVVLETQPELLSTGAGLAILGVIAGLFVAAFLFQRWRDAKRDEVNELEKVVI